MKDKLIKIARFSLFLLSVPLLIFCFVFATKQEKTGICQGVEVKIFNPETKFINAAQIKNTITTLAGIDNNVELNLIDVNKIEKTLKSNFYIAQAELFFDAHKKLIAHINLREPVVRIQRMDSTANGYYMDAQTAILPFNNQYHPNLPVISLETNITDVAYRKQLISFSQYIQKDTFWNACITQININKDREIEIYTCLTDAAILYGQDIDREDKFQRLFQFFSKGLNTINWKNVKEIDVRFKHQLICRRFYKEEQIEASQSPLMYNNHKAIEIKNPDNIVVKTTTKPTIQKNGTEKNVPKTQELLSPKPEGNQTPTAPIKQNDVVVEKPVQHDNLNDNNKIDVNKIENPIKPMEPKKEKVKQIIINPEIKN